MRTRAMKGVKRHGSTIFAVLAALGVVLTGYLAAKATPEAEEKLEQAMEAKAMAEAEETGEEADFENVTMTFGEKAKVVVPVYWKAIASGVITIFCIVGSRIVAIKELALVTGTLAATTTRNSKYRDAVKKVLGEEKEAELRKGANKAADEEIARKQSKKKGKKTDGGAIKTGLGNDRFYDPFNDRKFKCSVYALEKAAREINSELANGQGEEIGDNLYQMPLNNFWSKINMRTTVGSEMIGFEHEVKSYRTLKDCCEVANLDLSQSIILDGKVWTCVYFKTDPQAIAA